MNVDFKMKQDNIEQVILKTLFLILFIEQEK